MKKIGLGVQTFSMFKQENLVYVDKTETIYNLIDSGFYYFLSRPRRFGKSLLVNTMKELFEGNKELFEACWIYDHWNWDETFPVLNIDFTKVRYRNLGLEKGLDEYLTELAEGHNITLNSSEYSGKFHELIKKLGKKKKVVILIDEYDKPIIDYLEDPEKKTALENREILKSLYTGVKAMSEYIRFFFMTGVSKFSKVSIFSDLNHLSDITLAKAYSEIVGYTESEIQRYYQPYLERLAIEYDLSNTALIEKMREWYNGYSWDGRNFVYNPYSVISSLEFTAFNNYWFETGSPTFLINEFKKSGRKINESVNSKVSELVFNKYDIDDLNTTAIMFQTGYLTIKDYEKKEREFTLDFPNKEVRESFINFAVKKYAGSSDEEMKFIVDALVKALRNNKMDDFFTVLKSLFSSIAVKQLDKVKEYEGFYHSIFFIVLKIVGIQIQCEVQSSFGTTDAVIQTEDFVYIVEFKMGTAQEALDQIKEKKYDEPYLADPRKVVLVGFGFDKAQRNLVDFLSFPPS